MTPELTSFVAAMLNAMTKMMFYMFMLILSIVVYLNHPEGTTSLLLSALIIYWLVASCYYFIKITSATNKICQQANRIQKSSNSD
ncbi:MAG: hypothetical protein Tsb005_16220 [Gammaproteobacteria bacterium]